MMCRDLKCLHRLCDDNYALYNFLHTGCQYILQAFIDLCSLCTGVHWIYIGLSKLNACTTIHVYTYLYIYIYTYVGTWRFHREPSFPSPPQKKTHTHTKRAGHAWTTRSPVPCVSHRYAYRFISTCMFCQSKAWMDRQARCAGPFEEIDKEQLDLFLQT